MAWLLLGMPGFISVSTNLLEKQLGVRVLIPRPRLTLSKQPEQRAKVLNKDISSVGTAVTFFYPLEKPTDRPNKPTASNDSLTVK